MMPCRPLFAPLRLALSLFAIATIVVSRQVVTISCRGCSACRVGSLYIEVCRQTICEANSCLLRSFIVHY
jgi:hypothetical protein